MQPPALEASSPAFDAVFRVALEQGYPRGVQLFVQGQPLTFVWYITSGVVKLQYMDADGHESIPALAVAGAWLGTGPVMSEQATPVSAITCDVTRARLIPVRTWRQLLQADARLSEEVHRVHSRELCRQLRWIALLSSLNSRQRLEHVLTQLIAPMRAQSPGRTIRVRVPLHQWELARLIAITPEHLNRLLRDMQDDGILSRERGWLVVRDVSRLCTTCVADDGPWSIAV